MPLQATLSFSGPPTLCKCLQSSHIYQANSHSVWGIADGSRKLSVDAEIIAYAVLDVLAKPIFGLWLLITHANIPETNIDLGGFWSYGFGGEGAVRLEDDGA